MSHTCSGFNRQEIINFNVRNDSATNVLTKNNSYSVSCDFLLQ